MDNDQSIITVSGLYFSRQQQLILDCIDLSIPKNKIVAIMGPSGAGKTTLFKLLTAQIEADQGDIQIAGMNVKQMAQKQRYQLRRKMGVLFQQSALFTDLDVFDNVAFPVREHTDLPEPMIHDLVLMMLEAVGLRGAARLRIEDLSGGMARRVALARAVILGPEIMFYDEPFTGQDPISRGVLLQLIRQFNDVLGLTSILISHDVEATARVVDYIYLLARGRIIAEGPPQQLLEQTNPAVRQFMQGQADGEVPFHYPAADLAEEFGTC